MNLLSFKPLSAWELIPYVAFRWSQYIMNTDAVVTEHVKDSVTVLKGDQSYSPAAFTCVDRKQEDYVHWRSIFVCVTDV